MSLSQLTFENTLWDDCQHTAKLNLVVCGSVNRLMNRIFFDREQPLYGRNTGHLKLKPFSAALLKTILHRHKPSATNEDLWSLWTLTGALALCALASATTRRNPRFLHGLLNSRKKGSVAHLAHMIE